MTLTQSGREAKVINASRRRQRRKAEVVTDEIKLLATYLSGSNVAAASIGLELGGHAKTQAQPFFALREALGITGYATRDEAIAILSERLAKTQERQP